ncbi:hypothetical protein LSAT2_016849 [Lamellibrachia satsuma]|nr:hypothetical protein LSAT2_016849 [Lamellibrachia satsuma]
MDEFVAMALDNRNDRYSIRNDVYSVFKRCNRVARTPQDAAHVPSRLTIFYPPHVIATHREKLRLANRLPAIRDMYETSNSQYGTEWNTSRPFSESFTQSAPYKTLLNRRAVGPELTPMDKDSLATVHDPEHPCGIMSMSNVAMNTMGKFTNTRRDFYTDKQGLWTNSSFNRGEATLDRHLGTYSNLQGGWARVGPSTYDAIHSDGEWVPSWNIHAYEPATLRSMYDHPNVNPRYTNVPIENIPVNMDTVTR